MEPDLVHHLGQRLEQFDLGLAVLEPRGHHLGQLRVDSLVHIHFAEGTQQITQRLAVAVKVVAMMRSKVLCGGGDGGRERERVSKYQIWCKPGDEKTWSEMMVICKGGNVNIDGIRMDSGGERGYQSQWVFS